MKISKGKIVRTSITLDRGVAEIGKRNAEKRGFGHSFSAYVSWLVIRDSKGAVSREEIAEQSAHLVSADHQSVISNDSDSDPTLTKEKELENLPPYPGFTSRDPFAN